VNSFDVFEIGYPGAVCTELCQVVFMVRNRFLSMVRISVMRFTLP